MSFIVLMWRKFALSRYMIGKVQTVGYSLFCWLRMPCSPQEPGQISVYCFKGVSWICIMHSQLPLIREIIIHSLSGFMSLSV